jgi:hypothetical protein
MLRGGYMISLIKKLSLISVLAIVLTGCGNNLNNSNISETSTPEVKNIVSSPNVEQTLAPTVEPTLAPTLEPTIEPTTKPTAEPTLEPTMPVYELLKNEYPYMESYTAFGDWLSSNHVATIEDGEGSIIQESLDTRYSVINIKENDSGNSTVWIDLVIDEKYIIPRVRFQTAFNKFGEAEINEVNDTIDKITISFNQTRYTIDARYYFKDGSSEFISYLQERERTQIRRALEIIRERLGVNLNRTIVDGREVVIEYHDIVEKGQILIYVYRLDDAVVLGRYLFNPKTFEYEITDR